MSTGFRLAISLALACQLFAQAPAAAPLFTFDLQLNDRMAPGASLTFFVARASHLYFVGSDLHDTIVLQTDPQGKFQSSTTLGIPTTAAFDVDEECNLYALSDDSWMTVFYPGGGIQRTIRLEPKAITFALVANKPMIAFSDDRLHFLENGRPRFTLSSWPRPWTLFGVGSDRLGIWRPAGPTLSLLQMENGLSTRGLNNAQNSIAAAADLNGRFYLLNAITEPGVAQIQEFDEHLRPSWTSRLQLPAMFAPRMIGLSRDQIYLVDPTGKAAAYAASSTSETKVLADAQPELLTTFDKVREALKNAGWQGTVSISLVVGTEGTPQAIHIETPATLANHPEVIAAVQALRFRPKIQSGSAIASPLTLELGGHY